MIRYNPDRDFDEFDCEMLNIERDDLDSDIDYDGDDYDASFEEDDYE